jgi:hypothetical protein
MGDVPVAVPSSSHSMRPPVPASVEAAFQAVVRESVK